MFRVGKLRGSLSEVAKKEAGPVRFQRRCIQARSFLPGLASRTPGTLSATAQVTGGSKQQVQPQSHTIDSGPEDNSRWPRKVFSGIQPTGSLHLGNYLGAVRKWVQLQNARDDVTVCIVDLHSITMPHNPPLLRENIFTMAATLLACGIDPAKSTLFVQSAVAEHAEFNWILSSMTTMPRLAQLPQFREKSRLLKDVPLGLYVYPVLQAADIMLYKATHVPVGADQIQHIQLAQHLAKTYNGRYGETFPVCHAIVEDGDASRVLSLRDPSKKMSKSEANPKATINLCDSPDLITQKIKKAVTDFTSDITYNPGKRAGVSNLVNIHAQVTGQSIKTVVDEAATLDTSKYKDRVAEAVVEHLRPIREQIHHHMTRRNEMVYLLEVGAEKARQQAQQTLNDVKQRLGLGTSVNMPAAVHVVPLLPAPEVPKTSASRRMSKDFDGNVHERHERMYGFGDQPSGGAGQSATGELTEMSQASMPRVPRRPPVVPAQSLRVEKQLGSTRTRHVFQMDTCNAPHIGFKPPPGFSANLVTGGLAKNKRPTVKPVSGSMGFGQHSHGGSSKHGQNVNPSAVSTIAREVNAAKKQEFTCNVANSAFYASALDSRQSSNRSSEKSSSKAQDSEFIIVANEEEEQNSSEEQREETEEEEAVERERENGERKASEATKVEI
ncbi:tryptophan--tRNA ligase, mitochondrial isoform X2 [Drosophila rhopaloa]|uniref:tryptophan--tRNA ligase n=1 Tax=Drosophila rhopaloa TaxID=1041015 RepID=A0A6P4EV44_DRORH|nr:tryptophan--tRNA ligase, mitochondrial isoform X2 [Drosophila rhopaloa]